MVHEAGLPPVCARPTMRRIPMTTTLSPNDDAMPAVVEADISLPGDAAAVLAMLDAYSSDPMADGHPLSADARANLIAGLRAAGWTVLRVWECALSLSRAGRTLARIARALDA
jgi:hypothetical protein